MQSFSDDAVVRPVTDVLSADVGEEVAILALKEGKYFGLSEVGSHVWHEISREPKSIASLKDAVLQTFEVAPDVCERDLHNLLNDMLSAGLIEIRGA